MDYSEDNGIPRQAQVVIIAYLATLLKASDRLRDISDCVDTARKIFKVADDKLEPDTL